mgnify:FL=1
MAEREQALGEVYRRIKAGELGANDVPREVLEELSSMKESGKFVDFAEGDTQTQSPAGPLQPLPGPLENILQTEMGLPEIQQTALPNVPVQTELERAATRPEAELGFANRALYAIEPLQANRKAFLVQEFGAGNVFEDDGGELFLKDRKGQIVPVNAPGFTMGGDLSEVAAMAPEIGMGMIGAGAGGGIPGAMAGAAAGSLLRQEGAKLLGVPRATDMGEMFLESGKQGLFAGAGEIGGKAVGAVGSKYIAPYAGKIGKNIGKFIEEISPFANPEKQIVSEDA